MSTFSDTDSLAGGMAGWRRVLTLTSDLEDGGGDDGAGADSCRGESAIPKGFIVG